MQSTNAKDVAYIFRGFARQIHFGSYEIFLWQWYKYVAEILRKTSSYPCTASGLQTFFLYANLYNNNCKKKDYKAVSAEWLGPEP